MRKIATTVRCVPRYGYENTNVRTVDIDVQDHHDESELLTALQRWFRQRGLSDAVYGLDVDDYGFFAIINDEIYDAEWGTDLN